MPRKTEAGKAKAKPEAPHCPLCALQERLAGGTGESARHFRKAGLELLLGLKMLLEECLAQAGPEEPAAKNEPRPRRARKIAVE